MVTPGNRAGYSLLAIGVVIGLLFSWNTDNKIENFSIKQCKSNEIVYEVITNTLEGAKRRAIATLANKPQLQAASVASYQNSIDIINSAPKCKI